MTRFLTFTILALAFISQAHAVPCFDSLEAAKAAIHAHIAWQGRKGHFEYFKGHKGQHVKCDVAFPNTVSVLDRPRSRSTVQSRHPKAAGAGRISPPPETTGMNVSAPPPPAVTEWSIRVKTEPAKWPDEVSFDPPPLTMTAEQVKAAPVEEEPESHPMQAFFGPGGFFMLVGGLVVARGLRMPG